MKVWVSIQYGHHWWWVDWRYQLLRCDTGHAEVNTQDWAALMDWWMDCASGNADDTLVQIWWKRWEHTNTLWMHSSSGHRFVLVPPIALCTNKFAGLSWVVHCYIVAGITFLDQNFALGSLAYPVFFGECILCELHDKVLARCLHNSTAQTWEYHW